jgi:hypothetical protein
MIIFTLSANPNLAVESAEALVDCLLRIDKQKAVVMDYRDEAIRTSYELFMHHGFKRPIEYKNHPPGFHTPTVAGITPYQIVNMVDHAMREITSDFFSRPFLNMLRTMTDGGAVVVANPDGSLLARCTDEERKNIVQIQRDEADRYVGPWDDTFILKEDSKKLWQECKTYIEGITGATLQG